MEGFEPPTKASFTVFTLRAFYGNRIFLNFPILSLNTYIYIYI